MREGGFYGWPWFYIGNHDGKPTGEVEDFMTGFVTSNQAVWARPVGITVARDGAVLVSEDGNGTLWRVSYRESAK